MIVWGKKLFQEKFYLLLLAVIYVLVLALQIKDPAGQGETFLIIIAVPLVTLIPYRLVRLFSQTLSDTRKRKEEKER